MSDEQPRKREWKPGDAIGPQDFGITPAAPNPLAEAMSRDVARQTEQMLAAGDNGPDCRRCGKPTGKWWLQGTGTEGYDRMLCASCDVEDTQRALGLPERPVSGEETSG